MSAAGDAGRVVVRRAGVDDGAFFERLFVATRAEFSALPPDIAASIVSQQYEIRERQYRTRFPNLLDQVVEVHGRPAGRLSTSAGGESIIVVDLAVLPELQRRGVGSTLLTGLLTDADVQGVSVELSVSADNPAVRLYERFGFAASAHTETTGYLRMRREPEVP